MLRIGHIHIADNIHNTAIGLLWQAFVLATVACFHMEDRDMQTLRPYHRQTTIRVTQYQHSIRFGLNHYFIALVDDIPHGSTQVITHCLHVNIWILQLQILEEHTIQIVVIILSCMGQQAVKILPALVNYCRQSDNLRAGTYYNQQL